MRQLLLKSIWIHLLIQSPYCHAESALCSSRSSGRWSRQLLSSFNSSCEHGDHLVRNVLSETHKMRMEMNITGGKDPDSLSHLSHSSREGQGGPHRETHGTVMVTPCSFSDQTNWHKLAQATVFSGTDCCLTLFLIWNNILHFLFAPKNHYQNN